MSWRLVGEVMAWAASHDDPEHGPLHPRDRLILLTLAEEARDPSRRCTPGPGMLAGKVGLTARGLRKALQRLAARGLECRVSLMIGSDGRPVYAVPGRLQIYRVPPLDPALPQVTEGGTQVPPGGTQGPPGDTSEGRQAAPEGVTRQHPEAHPSPLALPPPPPTPAGSDVDELAIGELEVVVVRILKGRAPVPGRPVLRRALARLAGAGWTPAQLSTALQDHDWSGARAGAVVTWLRALDRPPAASEAAQERPEWCGECDETTRLVTDPDSGTVSRCPGCHPNHPDRRQQPA